MIWNEKYRPQTLDQVVGQQSVVATLKALKNVDIKDIPSMLFIGSPGLGKTTAARAFAKELNLEFRDFNASTDRSVEFIRGELNRLSKLITPSQRKIVFLDEFDNMLWEAQFALRRIMEDNFKTTIFILSVNYPNKVIEPIYDRCTPMYFNKLSREDYLLIAQRIEEIEGIKFKFNIDEVIDNSKDARQFVQYLFIKHIGGMLPKQEFDLQQYIQFIKACSSPDLLSNYYFKVSSSDFLSQILKYLSSLNKNDKLTETLLKIGDILLYNPNMDEYAMKLVVSLRLWKIRELL